MRLLRPLLPILLLSLLPSATEGQGVETGIVIDAPEVVLVGIPFSIGIAGADGEPLPYEVRTPRGTALASGTLPPAEEPTIGGIVISERTDLPLEVQVGTVGQMARPTLLPGWSSLVPPLLAILLALILREAIVALFASVWVGALAISGFDPIAGTWYLVDSLAVTAVADMDGGHPQIVVFSLLLGGMVGIITRNGGSMGIVHATARFASTRRRGRLATWLAGVGIFFDDYANCLIVGNTMRSITDRLRISREKLAYLVDSTAAPVAALVPLSTWIGYEISLIADGLRIAGEQNPALAAPLSQANPFTVFIETIPFRFYPLLALYFALMTILSGRDFGPMASAERRAARGDGVHRPGARLSVDTRSQLLRPKDGAREVWWNAALPILSVVIVVLLGLYQTGRAGAGPEASILDVFGEADPFSTLLWGSLTGCLVAAALTAAQRILSLGEVVEAMVGGMAAMMPALLILVLAWSLGAVTEEVGTAHYLSQLLSDRVPLRLLPVLVFLTAALMSFATGTSWGTMAILIPLVIPLTVALGGYAPGFGDSVDYSILLGTISSVLAGAVFGDHCSPISDTTVLSSMAAGCDHVDHVRTQLPYALLVGGVGMLLGDIGTAYGLPVWVALGGSMLVLWLVLRSIGIRSDDHEGARDDQADPVPVSGG